MRRYINANSIVAGDFEIPIKLHKADDNNYNKPQGVI